MRVDVRNAAVAHALAEYPREAVGYVKDNKYVKLKNLLPPTGEINSTNSFDVGREVSQFIASTCIDYLVHSHSNGTNYPTKDDLVTQAAMAVPWYIVVLTTNKEQKPSHPATLLDCFEFGTHMPTLPYEGRPFRYGVNDCSTLARDWYRQELKLDIPPFHRDFGFWDEGDDWFVKSLNEAGFEPVTEKFVKRGDLVMMRHNTKVVNHIGVYIGNGDMLHHAANRLSKRASIEAWRGCISGYFRYVGK